MEIKKHEFNKILKSPIVMILIVIFMIYNTILIFNNSYIKEDLKLATSFIKEFGYKVNEDMLDKIDKTYEVELEELDKITLRKFQKEYKGIEEFLDSKEFLQSSTKDFSSEEIQLLDRLSVMNTYKSFAIDLIKEYEEIDIDEIIEGSIKSYGISGKAAEVVRRNYSDLGKRLEELKENEEHKNIYFLGKVYRTHKLLFKDILRTVIYEIMILTVLITTCLINYERDNGTELLIASTGKGRSLIKDKLIISIVWGIIVAIILIIFTLAMYFMIFDYSEVWKVPISSALNWETAPMISWYNLNFLQYLSLAIVVILVSTVIFGLITFVISNFTKSSYISFFVFFIIFGGFCMVQKFINKDTSMAIYSNLNVFIMTLNPNMWFGEAGPMLTIKNYEAITLISNFIIVGLLSIISIIKFKREDIL